MNQNPQRIQENAMTAIHEQLIRDHVAQLLRDAHRANQSKRAHRSRRISARGKVA
jgi:hypothetical protein